MFKIRKRSRLPHWHGTERPYFVTFNLADAIPTDVYERLKVERHIRIAELERMKRTATAAELHAIDRVIRERVEEALDEGHGKCWMGDAFRTARLALGPFLPRAL